MAEIPMEKKSDVSLRKWLLLLLVLIGLIWLLYEIFIRPKPDERLATMPPSAIVIDSATNTIPAPIAQIPSAVDAASTAVAAGTTGATGTNTGIAVTTNSAGAGDATLISDVGMFASMVDKLSLVGRQVAFTDAQVAREVGPKTFTLTSGNDEMFVIVDQDVNRAVGTQGQIDKGKVIDIRGTFQRMTEEEINNLSDRRFRELTEQERAVLRKTQIYLHATDISKVR